MLIDGSDFRLHDVIQRFEDSNTNTENFVRCFLNRDKIKFFSDEVLVPLKNIIQDLDVGVGFIHPKVQKVNNDTRGDLSPLNEFRGLVLKCDEISTLEKRVSVMENVKFTKCSGGAVVAIVT